MVSGNVSTKSASRFLRPLPPSHSVSSPLHSPPLPAQAHTFGIDSAKTAAALGANAAAEEVARAAGLLESDAALEVARGQMIKCIFRM